MCLCGVMSCATPPVLWSHDGPVRHIWDCMACSDGLQLQGPSKTSGKPGEEEGRII